jgi:hypothetical protein
MMIDTLKLSRRLQGAGMNQRQAEELAEGLAEGLSTAAVSREHFDAKLDAFYWRIIAAVAGLLLAHLAAVWLLVWNLARSAPG